MTEAISQLDQLKALTTIVADTGDFETMRQYHPQDATTNPSLILKASQQADYRHLVDQAISELQAGPLGSDALVESIIDRILILFGKEILKIVPGRVSTETDARLSFDVAGTVDKARTLIGLYEQDGISRDRILIKIASTWEGIRAAEILQKRRHPLQSDPTLLPHPGSGLRRCEGTVDLPLCRPHLRLVQSSHRRGIQRCRRSRRAIGRRHTTSARKSRNTRKPPHCAPRIFLPHPSADSQTALSCPRKTHPQTAAPQHRPVGEIPHPAPQRRRHRQAPTRFQHLPDPLLRCLHDFLVQDDICAFHVCMIRLNSVYFHTRLSREHGYSPWVRLLAPTEFVQPGGIAGCAAMQPLLFGLLVGGASFRPTLCPKKILDLPEQTENEP
jgi:hypothetical protein